MLSAEDITFVRQHAYDYALPAGSEAACDYAAWYVPTYAETAETLDDCPSHSSAYRHFQDTLYTCARCGETFPQGVTGHTDDDPCSF